MASETEKKESSFTAEIKAKDRWYQKRGERSGSGLAIPILGAGYRSHQEDSGKMEWTASYGVSGRHAGKKTVLTRGRRWAPSRSREAGEVGQSF